ncbi:MAG: metallophosphoesterase [Clostridia bacterium]|nr:metallophosphoesterase [Clostridia bacterium]
MMIQKRLITVLLTICLLLTATPFAVSAAGTTYAVTALSFTAGYASTTDGRINRSAVTAYDALDTYHLRYGDEPTELASTSGIPYQMFDVDLGGRTSGEVALHYSGSTKKGERVALKAYNVQSRDWDTIGTFKGSGSVSASVDVATYNDGGKIHVAAMLDYVTNGSNGIIWSTDPQCYTKFDDLHEYYYKIYQYAADEYAAGRAGYLFTTGDLVDNRPSSSEAPDQWKISSRAMEPVEAIGMPNGVVSGNHDVNTFDNPDFSSGPSTADYSLFCQTYPASRYENTRWYGGSLNNNVSHYDLVTIGNVDFLFLFLGYGLEATDETIVWANNVLKTYPHRAAVVATHEYLDAVSAERAGRGQLIYDTIVDPNPNVKLVVCGHDDGSVCRPVTASDGRTVYEVLADYQYVEAEDRGFYANEHYIGKVRSCCGDGYIRLLTVEGSLLKSVTYSPVTGRYNPYGSIENLSIDLELDAPDRAFATNVFSAAVLGSATSSTTVDRITKDGNSYSAVTYASIPTKPAEVDPVNWPSTTYGAAATPDNPYYAHAAKTAPTVKFKVDLLQKGDLGAHPVVHNPSVHVGNYALDLAIDLNRTPYLYYSFAQPAGSGFSFALISDTSTAPWITFLDMRKGGSTLNSGAENWDNAGGAQYLTTSATGCIDMRKLVSKSGATTWTVEQLNLFSSLEKDVMVSYLFFGSEPLDLIGSNYGSPATPAVPYAHHAAKDAPAVLRVNNLLHAVSLNDNAVIWGSVHYSANSLSVDLSKTPYLYYSFSQSSSPKFTFALISNSSNMPWITFLDTRLGGATLNSGNDTWDAAAGAQFFRESATGCIDMRQFLTDTSSQRISIDQVKFYNPNGAPVMVNYLFFGSAAVGGKPADLKALDAMLATSVSTDGMTTDSVNQMKAVRMAAASADRTDAFAVARLYAALSFTVGGLTPVFETEVSASGLQSVKNYSMTPGSWLCGATGKALSSSESHVSAVATGGGMRLRRSSAATTTWPSIVCNDSYTVQPYGGVYLKLDASMQTGWAITLNVTQDGVTTRVRLNAGIVNSFNNLAADCYYGVYQNIYDVSDVFLQYGVDPTATFKVENAGITTVGSGSGWNYYYHLELLTGAKTSASYTALREEISYAQGLTKSLYTTASWNALQSAIEKAQTSVETSGLSQPQINLPLYRLKNAESALVLKEKREPYGGLLATDPAAWHTNKGLVTVSRSNDTTTIANTNGSWSSADHFFDVRRVSTADSQLELTMTVTDRTNILLLADGEWIGITRYLSSNLSGDDIQKGDYTLIVPLSTIFSDRPAVALEGVRIWSVGAVGSNAVTIRNLRVDRLDTHRFDPSLTYGVAATPDNPAAYHAAKRGPSVAEKVDVLAACGLHQPTVTGYSSYGWQRLHLTIDLTKTPYLYYSIAQSSTSQSTFGLHNENDTAPFFCFADATRGAATMSTSADTWDAYTNNRQYFTGSVTGCIDMRTLLKDPSATEWQIKNVSLYATTGSSATFSYLYFGSAALNDGYVEETPAVPGDLSGDGKLTSSDARILVKSLTGGSALTAAQQAVADANGDKKINTGDVRYILRMLTHG